VAITVEGRSLAKKIISMSLLSFETRNF